MTALIMSDSETARFWSKVALPDENGCMLWLGAPDRHGYGVLKVDGRIRKAHRLSLLLAVGEPSSTQTDAAHGCRNRHCVAPEHLRWATRQENVGDRLRDGTHQFGERNARAKLSYAKAEDIRTAYAAGGVSQRQLAQRYGVSHRAIIDVLWGRSWQSPPVSSIKQGA